MIVGMGRTENGRRLIILGVERENIKRLTGGRPIAVTPENHNIPDDLEIVIFFGETAQDMIGELTKAGIDAKQLIDRRDEGRRSS